MLCSTDDSVPTKQTFFLFMIAVGNHGRNGSNNSIVIWCVLYNHSM